MTFKKFFSSWAKENSSRHKSSETLKLIKDIKKIILILTSVFLFLIIWNNRIKLHPDNVLLWLKGTWMSFRVGNGFPQEILGQAVAAENFAVIGRNPVVLSDSGFTVFNSSGCTIRTQRHNFSTPLLKIGGLRAIIYDLGGKNYKIESCAKSIYSSKTDNNIISCSIAENGKYAVVTESQNYLSELKVYDSKNSEKYGYYFSEHYICDFELNSSGDQGVACGINTEDGNINSYLYILNFKSKEPQNKFKLENNLVTKVKYFSNGNILAIGDNYLSVINQALGSIKNFSFDAKLLKFYDFKRDKGICFCLSPSEGKSCDDEIVVIDMFGKESICTSTNENLKSLAYFGNRIIAFAKDKLYAYNCEGKFEGYINNQPYFKKIIMESGSCAYALKGNEIYKIKINNLKKNS